MRSLWNRWAARRNAKIKQPETDEAPKAALARFGAAAAQYPKSEYESIFEFAREHISGAQSQILQDVFVLYETKCKRNGFFVEFGAGNGMFLSNSYLLNRHYGWQGILAEPARVHHAALTANRNCRIDKRCVWTQSGEILPFNETDFAEFSTLEQFSEVDMHAQARASGLRYPVETISLHDLLVIHQAPREIDYLSIDTEGSEFDILTAFDWNSFCFGLITVEHNYTSQRTKLHELLTAKGYARKFEEISGGDDWYVKL
jgi:FkbM family methyltransferase